MTLYVLESAFAGIFPFERRYALIAFVAARVRDVISPRIFPPKLELFVTLASCEKKMHIQRQHFPTNLIRKVIKKN